MIVKLWINIRKLLSMTSVYFYTPINKIRFALNGVKYEKGFRAKGNIYIYKHYYAAEVKIGRNVFINSAGKANPIGTGNKTYIQMVDNGQLIIGNNCGISNTAFTCASRIEIENNVLLGSGCKIYDTDFHALDYSERVKGNYPGAPIKTAPIVIKEGAFIGAGSFVLKGVQIGKHSVIGAGSVVTRNVPDYEIWGGNPARFIKKIEEEKDDSK